LKSTNTWSRLIAAAILVTPCPGNAQTSVLVVDGEVESRLALSLDDLRSMGHQRIEMEQQGVRATYEGVPLVEVLRRAGVRIGRSPLQGKELTSILFVTGFDGFQAVFALAELDPASIDQRVLLADARDGRPLAGDEGPLRLIVPADKYPLRSVRHVIRLTVTGVAAPPRLKSG
jgi:DMSO/TMAO reductase YedYZ molybdopterin-dependent catalytic subunit